MNKTIFKILIATIVFLIGIGVASAVDSNSSDEAAAAEQADEISVDEADVAGVENGNDEAGDEVIALEDNDELSVATDENQLASNVTSDDGLDKGLEYKTFVVGKIKVSKKFAKLVPMEKKLDKYKKKIKKAKSNYKKTHANKYKKAVKKLKFKYKDYKKKYKKLATKFKKAFNKRMPAFEEATLKRLQEIMKYNWKPYTKAVSTAVIKGKYWVFTFKMDFCRGA